MTSILAPDLCQCRLRIGGLDRDGLVSPPFDIWVPPILMTLPSAPSSYSLESLSP